MKQLDTTLPETDLALEADWGDMLYEKAVRPGQVVVVNAYFLRFLPLIGPELAWLYIAFRQSAYNLGARNGQRTGRFSGASIAALSGASRRTFWRRIATPETWEKLSGLVRWVEEKPQWQNTSDAPRRAANRYVVSMSLPLTGPDTFALRRWLIDNLEACGGPTEVVSAACTILLDKLLAEPGASESETPMMVSALLREIFNDLPDAEIRGLAEKLTSHIMPVSDTLHLHLSFIRNLLPLLGTGQGWLLSILRDKCWNSRGKDRGQVVVSGGYAEMSNWLGLSRPKTIWEWLRDPVLQIYIHLNESGLIENGKWDAPRTLDVLTDEIPVELRVIAQSINADDGDAFDRLVDKVAQVAHISGANGTIGVAQVAHISGANGTSEWREWHIRVAQVAQAFKLLSIKAIKNYRAPKSLESKTGVSGADAPVCVGNSKPKNPDAFAPTSETPKPEPPKRAAESPKPANEPKPALQPAETSKSAGLTPEEIAARIAAFGKVYSPEVGEVVGVFCSQFGIIPPAMPRGKNYKSKKWFDDVNELKATAGEYGVTPAEAINAVHDIWKNHYFNVVSPRSLVNVVAAAMSVRRQSDRKVAETKAALAADVPATPVKTFTPEEKAALEAKGAAWKERNLAQKAQKRTERLGLAQ